MKTERISITDIPELLEIWDRDANYNISLLPEKVSVGSQKKAFWICKKHNTSYSQIIRSRYRGQTGCEKCKAELLQARGREQYINNKHTLAETNPELIEEWVSCENQKFTPYTCLPGSKVSVKWKCIKCGGEYLATVSNRARLGAGCPYCSGQKVLQGYNDLQTLKPELAQEWSVRNLFLPSQVTLGSNKMVLWNCRMGHKDYLMSIKQRKNGQGCPECAIQSHPSFPEQAMYYYMKKVFPDAENRYKYDRYEIDVFVPSKGIGVEYNGSFYHRKKN